MKTLKITSAAVLALSLLSAAPAFAATAGSYITQGTAGFSATTPPVTTPPVVNPTNPTNPVGPGVTPNPAPVAPGTPGNTTSEPLTIDYAPTLKFGTGSDSVTAQTLYAQAQKWSDGTTSPNYLQVTDSRGTNAGWFVTLAASPFTSTSSATLTGATLMFSNGNIVGPSVNLADQLFNTDKGATVATDSSVNNIFGATAGHGSGTNLLEFGGTTTTDSTGEKSIALNIPNGAAQAESYTSTLTWTMNNVPS